MRKKSIHLYFDNCCICVCRLIKFKKIFSGSSLIFFFKFSPWMITRKTHVYFPIFVKHWIRHCVNRKVLNRNCQVRPSTRATPSHLWPRACSWHHTDAWRHGKCPGPASICCKEHPGTKGSPAQPGEIAAVPSGCQRQRAKGSNKAAHMPFVFTLS